MDKLKIFEKKHLNKSEVIKGFLGIEKDKSLFEHKYVKAFKKPTVLFTPRKTGLLKFYLEKAGIDVESGKFSLYVFRLAVFINLVISLYLIYRFSTDMKIDVLYVTIAMTFVWVIAFFFILFIVWFFIFVMIDLRVFKRRIGIEDVLPDFLQLTSANIRAGMPLDKALWYAVRPRFGVLANEIEMVAKETMSGEDLDSALTRFADKYDSAVLKRSINLLIESYNAGGEIGDILNKIADNIKENQIMKKEMSANVTTYAIFIGFATVLAAPILFALSGQFLIVVNKILSTIDVKDMQGTGGFGFSFMFSDASVSSSDFMIFALLCLSITSFFSAAIVATIRKGNIKSGLSYFPAFVGITIALYFVWSFVLGMAMKGLF